MKIRCDARLPLITLSLSLLLAMGAFRIALATEPAPADTSASVAPASGSATPPGTVARAPGEVSPESGWLPPETKSEQPKPSEWESAVTLELPRVPRADGVRNTRECSAKVLREWVQVSCARPKHGDLLMGVRVLAGPIDDVRVLDPSEPIAGDMRRRRGLSLVFPVRRGDRRTIEIAEMLPLAWKSWTVEESLGTVVSALWLPNAARPTVTVY